MTVGSSHWLLVPVVALAATVVGAIVVYAAGTGLTYLVPPGEGALGVTVWLLVGAALAVIASAIGGLAMGLAGRDAIGGPAAAIRQGLLLAVTLCTGYLLAAILIVILA
jgi:hypothetical protein